MGEEGDQQRLKKIAAAAYDYENDPRWKDYWANVLIPPHMASRTDVRDHFKHKFYQRYIDPGLVVEPMASSSSSQPTRASTTSSSTPPNENSRPRSTGPSTGSGTSAASTRNTTPQRLDRRSIHFSANAWVLVVSVLGLLPLVPRNIANKAYRLSLLGTTCSSLYSIYTLYGKPNGWNMPAIQTWLQSVIVAKDFIHFLYSLMFVSSQLHFKFALIPVFCWALEHVAKFLRRNFSNATLYRKYLEEPCVWVEANVTTLNILSSNVEIVLGFLLIVSLFSWQRNIIQTFMYWHLLKLMYHAPATAGYHQSVWVKIGRSVTPYIHQYAPFLNGPVSAIQRWWLRLKIMGLKLQGGHLKQLRDIFTRFDMDSDGSLTLLELAALLRSLGLKPSGDQLHSLLSNMDANGNGFVEFDELADALAPMMSDEALVNQAQLVEVFRSFDRDGNGFISAAELARSMARMGHPLSFLELTEMMREADTDGDGVISFHEFAAVMAKSASDFLGLAAPS
ncbi:hypothetical protein J5N97_019514 [Dioscorea zingiberensis]|uniref:EF-hand domain-containing protein n=1 Tax=Dioscorea zingiberensis TaxID=325984 RepID=A0A9D5CEV8_9LILI|nr:hypothetical protein J5N97_019514 [Dioscorea zingiberensis]